MSSMWTIEQMAFFFQPRPVPGTDIKPWGLFSGSKFLGDTTQLTRTRWKTCVSEGCFPLVTGRHDDENAFTKKLVF